MDGEESDVVLSIGPESGRARIRALLGARVAIDELADAAGSLPERAACAIVVVGAAEDALAALRRIAARRPRLPRVALAHEIEIDDALELSLLAAGAHEVETNDRLERAMARARVRAASCQATRWVAAARVAGVDCFEWDAEEDRIWTQGVLDHVRAASSMSEVLSRIDPRDAERVESSIHDALAHASSFAATFRFRDDPNRWWLARGTVDATSRPILGAIAEVTELRRELEAVEFVLDGERTARRRAEHANRAHDEFLAIVSHELRTPLSAVLGWAQILRGGKYEERHLAKAIEVIERNAKAQERIVSDLLDVGRVIAGKLVIDHVRLRLADPVRAAVESLRATAERANVELQLGPVARDVWVFGDNGRLQQVAANLVANAIKFTPPGGRVRVSVELAQDRARIVVQDSGAGLSQRDIATVFDRFRQAHEGDRRRGGLGLGLAITKQLVELHGGTISAASGGDGMGSTFTVELPVANAADRVEVELALFTDTPALAGTRVLLVDDDLDSIDLAQIVLKQSRAEVHVATRASDALERFRAERWDAVISDLGLPDYDGFQLVRRMREAERRAARERTVAVCATAFARDADRDRALASGFDAHLAKPIPPHLLVTTVLGLLRREPVTEKTSARARAQP